MPSKTHSVDVTQLFSLLKHTTLKASFAEFAGSDPYTLRIEAHAPGVFRLRFGEPKHLHPEKITPRAQQRIEMLLARPDAVGEFSQEQFELSPQSWQLEQGEYRLELEAEPFALQLYKGEDCLVRLAPQGLASPQSNAEAVWHMAFALQEQDALYGLGDAFTLNRRGCVLRSSQLQDRVLPLLWSTQGWGIYINTLQPVTHDVAATDSNIYTATLADPVLDVFLFAGAPTEILNQYTALTGRAGQPGVWPMGVWLDQAAGQSLEESLADVEALRTLGVGLDALALAAPAAYGFSSDRPLFEWEAARIPDFRETIPHIHASNVQFASHSFPGVLVGTPLFDEWEDRGWLLTDDETGYGYEFPGNEVTGGQAYGLLDLTHRDAFKLWSERQRQSFDEGLGAPMCSVAYDFPDTVTARSGESGEQLRILYPILARQALFDAFAGHKTPQEGVVLSSDVFPGAQRYALQLGPEVSNDWAGMEHSLRSALALGNSGITAQTHRLGNANAPTDTMTPELFIRWLAMGVFSANFSFQGAAVLLPTAFDADTQALAQHWLRWRYRLVPYILGIIEESVRCGLPVQRSMALEFPHDPVAQQHENQYMLGSALLVVPFLRPGDEIEVYLPAGHAWWDLSTGWRYEGGTTWTVKAGLDRLPVFGREGHMLCLGPEVANTTEFNSARLLEEVWMFGMPEHSPEVMRNKIRVMQMQGSSYIKGLEGLKILPSEGLEVKRRGAEVRISRAR